MAEPFSMELTGVEPVSALSNHASLIHRYSLSNPQGGSFPLSRKQDASMKVLAGAPTEGSLPEHPLGV